MCDVLETHGLDAAAALTSAGLPPTLPDRESTISAPTLIAFRRAFVARTADRPELWSLVAGRYTLELTQPYGMASRTAPNLRAIVEVLADGDLHSSLVEIRGIDDPRGALVGIEFDASAAPPEIRDFELVLAIVSLIRSWDSIWAAHLPYTRMELPPQLSLAEIGRTDHAHVTRTTSNPRLHWTAEVGTRELPGANVHLHTRYVQQLRRQIAELRRTTSLPHRIRERMRTPDGVTAPIAQIAADVGMSPRTLQRELAAHGVTFQQLQEQEKRERAVSALTRSTALISTIAHDLGYATPSSFGFAFRTWFGESPSEYRARHRAPASPDP